eukprot:m.8886 g.8886  ORF g.8886 m.8886 type:complete len:67 (+) comp3968_c0_seq1:7140-7340(+)
MVCTPSFVTHSMRLYFPFHECFVTKNDAVIRLRPGKFCPAGGPAPPPPPEAMLYFQADTFNAPNRL